MLPLLGANPLLYSKIVDYSGKKRKQKHQMIKTGNIFSVALYPRGVVILGGAESAPLVDVDLDIYEVASILVPSPGTNIKKTQDFIIKFS